MMTGQHPNADHPPAISTSVEGAAQQAGHTEGPWYVERAENLRSFISGNTEDNAPIKNGGVYVAHALGKDHSANARLIAAAPDMLAALRKLTTDIATDQTLMDAVSLSAYEDASAAIAKAEGRE